MSVKNGCMMLFPVNTVWGFLVNDSHGLHYINKMMLILAQ